MSRSGQIGPGASLKSPPRFVYLPVVVRQSLAILGWWGAENPNTRRAGPDETKREPEDHLRPGVLRKANRAKWGDLYGPGGYGSDGFAR